MASDFLYLPPSAYPGWKSPVADAAALPALNNTNGDVRVTLDTGYIWEWNGSSWQLSLNPGAGVTSLNGLTGSLTLVAGTGISITPSGSNITITNTGGGGSLIFADSLVNTAGTVTLVNDSASPGNSMYYGTNSGGTKGFFSVSAGSGSVTTVSVVSANGLAGTVANPTTTPALTLSTTITGILQGNGTAISAATTGNLTDAGTDGITVTGGTGAVLGSGTSISQHVADTTHNGYLSSTDWNTFNGKTSGGITALTGDGTASGPGSAALTLATVNSNVGSFGSSSSIPSFTVNGKGLITAASGNAVIAPAGTLSGTTLNSTVVSSSLTSVGTITSGVWNGTAVGPTFGGTGLTSYTTGDTLYASATNVLSKLAIGSTGNVLTVSGGVPMWVAPATSGTVTSVALADGSTSPIYSISGSPVTSSGTLTFTLGTQAANKVFAGPTTGAAAQPTFRSLVAADLPGTTVLSIGTIDGNSASANGLSIASQVLYAQSASVSNPGMVNNTTQSMSGAKTFTGNLTASASSTTALTVGSTTMIVDSTNTVVGIGLQPATNVMIDGINTTGASKLVQMTGYGVGSSTGYRGRFARGTSGSPAAVQSGDVLNVISGRGYGLSQFPAASTGIINVVAGETFSNTSNATYLQFLTTPTASVTAVEAMRIAPTGNVLIDTVTDNGTDGLQIGSGAMMGYLKLNGSTSGYIQEQAAATTTTYTITWPAAQGAAGTVLTNNGSGALSWGTTLGSSGGTSVVNLYGAVNYTTKTVTTTYTVDTTTTDYIIFVDTTSAAFTITLPAPTNGRVLYFKDITGQWNTNNLTLAPHGSEKIEGLTGNKLLTTAWGSMQYTSNGTDWFEI